MNFLPDDLVQFILPYLGHEDQIQIVLCSKRLYVFRKKAIQLKLSEESVIRCLRDIDLCDKVFSLVENPSNQLSIELWVGIFCRSFPFREINLMQVSDLAHFYRLCCLNPYSKIRSAEIIVLEENAQHMNMLVQMCERSLLESLNLRAHAVQMDIPYFPNLQSLTICSCGFSRAIQLPQSYTSHLQKLVLSSCRSIDVSCIGTIPDLSIIDCQDITGISFLQRNQRIAWIDPCKDIDFSECFTHSERIEIRGLLIGDYTFDFSNWKQVRYISLCNEENYSSIHITGILSSTVRRCYLSGDFVSSVNWQGCVHQLIELHLSNCSSLTSLKGLGLERIPIVKLLSLSALSSIKGLGRNQCVSIEYCDLIKDFSPVKKVDRVRIYHCQYFQDLRHVNQVRDLEIASYSSFWAFQHLSQNIEVFSLHYVLLPTFRGLEKIPHLRLTFQHISVFTNYLKRENGILENHIIKFYGAKYDKALKQLENAYEMKLKDCFHLSTDNHKEIGKFRAILIKRQALSLGVIE